MNYVRHEQRRQLARAASENNNNEILMSGASVSCHNKKITSYKLVSL